MSQSHTIIMPPQSYKRFIANSAIQSMKQLITTRTRDSAGAALYLFCPWTYLCCGIILHYHQETVDSSVVFVRDRYGISYYGYDVNLKIIQS